MKITVREALPDDNKDIATLSAQLGYETTRIVVGEIIDLIAVDEDKAILVAEVKGRLVGWTQLVKQRLIIKDHMGTITSFVVDENHRGAGIGSNLLDASEQWFRERGCKSVLVRSNTVRKPAHSFYLKHGYEHFKTSENFRKSLK